ncbi:hypothetical protein GPALN_003296 [Globodera pallida]|nr:hypothetical protein GPALN_003296 [Globodera pallida]
MLVLGMRTPETILIKKEMININRLRSCVAWQVDKPHAYIRDASPAAGKKRGMVFTSKAEMHACEKNKISLKYNEDEH